jgi:hypothetical protein
MFMAGLLLTLLMILLGCSPGHIAAGKNNGVGIWQYTGCHVVSQSPSHDGAFAIHPLGDLQVADKFYFKQATSLDGSTVAPVTTGRPCREGD